MKSPWRLLGLAAALNVTLVGPAAAQRVMLRNAPAGTPVEVMLNADKVADGTVSETGDVTLGFTLPEKDGKAEMDANVFVDVCDKLRRVVILDRSRPAPPPAAGCDRREISGLFWVRRVNTIVIDVGTPNPTLLLISGSYTPPRPKTPEEEAGESAPHAPLPKGFVMFAGGGFMSLRDAVNLTCGSATPCSGKASVPSYSFGATYWLTRYLGVEASYLKPRPIKTSGGEGFTFDTALDADIWTITGKAGAQGGPVRFYGQGGVNYHQATTTTNETIDTATQKFEIQTKGWSWVFGGGAEVWVARKVALYGQVDFASIKGDATDGSEFKIDDRARSIVAGVRVHIGG